MQAISVLLGSSPHTWGIRMRPVGSVPAPPGSSPHTWGIRTSVLFQLFQIRFIPTYVGHTDNVHQVYQVQRRFIPTYVGHTRAGSPPILRRTVHPHIRGAYSGSGKSRSLKNGSSPHTWGILQGRHVHLFPTRFIPTYVGHTGTHQPASRHPPVHPHIRGAYTGPP